MREKVAEAKMKKRAVSATASPEPGLAADSSLLRLAPSCRPPFRANCTVMSYPLKPVLIFPIKRRAPAILGSVDNYLPMEEEPTLGALQPLIIVNSLKHFEMISKSLSSANPSLGSRGELDSPPSEARGTSAASAVHGGVSSVANAAAGPPASVVPKTKSGVGTINGQRIQRRRADFLDEGNKLAA